MLHPTELAHGERASERGRAWVHCQCGKRRVLFAPNKLTAPELTAIRVWLEGFDYNCGQDVRLIAGNIWELRANEALSCGLPIEVAYYSGANFSWRSSLSTWRFAITVATWMGV